MVLVYDSLCAVAYKRILVGIDFSECSKIATDLALHIARSNGAEVMFLHVGYVPELPDGIPDSMSNTAGEYHRIAKASLEDDRANLVDWGERYHGQGVDIRNMVVEGVPDKAICEVGVDWNADLICVGTHGRTGMTRFVLGSVAERVVRSADTDVLVVRKNDRDTDEQGAFRSILIGTDFSESSQHTLEAARNMAAPQARIELVHCVAKPTLGQKISELGRQKVFQELDVAVRDVMHERGQAFLDQQNNVEANLSFNILLGDPREVLAEHAKENEYDLIALGTRGEKGLRGFLLGSVAESTVRFATSSVLVSRIHEQ